MIKSFTIIHFIILFASVGSLLSSCKDSASKDPAEYTTSLVPVPGSVNDTETASDTETRAYKPLLWEVKWASRRVFDFDSNYNKICKTEFTNPYHKSIKEIKVGYEIRHKNSSQPVIHEKVIQLHLLPNEKKIIDTGIGCRDFYMYEVVFEDGEVI